MTTKEIESQTRYRAKNPEKVRLWARNNRNRHIEYHRENSLSWYRKNKERASRNHAKWLLVNRKLKRPILTPQQRLERKKTKRSEYLVRNRDKILAVYRAYRLKNAERIKLREKNRVRNDSPETKEKSRLRLNRRYLEDPAFCISVRLRRRIYMALKYSGARKSQGTEALIGCSVGDLKKHLESKFLLGMTWEGRKLWHIDHKKPCASFDLSDPREQRKCFHYSNLQPLWAKDNLRKGSRFERVINLQ